MNKRGVEFLSPVSIVATSSAVIQF